EARDATVEHDAKIGMRGFEPIDASIIERRNIAVLARRQTLKPRLARVNDERGSAGALDRAGERLERLLRVLIVDADATFDGDGQLDRSPHGGDAIAHESRLRHETGAEAALLYAIGGTADIEVDLFVAEPLGGGPPLGKWPRVAP